MLTSQSMLVFPIFLATKPFAPGLLGRTVHVWGFIRVEGQSIAIERHKERFIDSQLDPEI